MASNNLEELRKVGMNAPARAPATGSLADRANTASTVPASSLSARAMTTLTQLPAGSPRAARAAASNSTTPTPTSARSLSALARLAGFGNTVTAMQGAGQSIEEAYDAGGLPSAVGAVVRNTMVPAVGLGHDLYNSARTLTDPIAQATRTALTGDPTPIRAQQRLANAPSLPARASTPEARGPAAQLTAIQRLTGTDPAQSSYDAYRAELRKGIAGQSAGPGLAERGNAGLRALANDPSLVGRLNEQYQTDNIGVQAKVGPNGRMQFSDAPTDPSRTAAYRALSSYESAPTEQIQAETASMRADRLASQSLRDEIGFNGGGALSRRISPEEQAQNMLASTSRSDRQAALAYRANQRRNDIEERQTANAARLAGQQFEQAGVTLEQQQRINGLQREYVTTTDPARRKQIVEALRNLNGSQPARAQVVYGEEAIDPAQPAYGTKKIPMLLNADGTGTPVTPRGQTRALPNGISRQQAIEAARRAVQNGSDPAAVMGRLGEFGLTLEDIGQ